MNDMNLQIVIPLGFIVGWRMNVSVTELLNSGVMKIMNSKSFFGCIVFQKNQNGK